MRSTQARVLFTNKRKKASTKQAFVEVILGRLSANCKHLGICKIESVHSNNSRYNKGVSCASSSGVFAIASCKEGDYFELVFERKSIPDSVYKLHFQSGVFKVEEIYSTKLDISTSPIVISVGEYNINFSDTLFSIRFQL